MQDSDTLPDPDLTVEQAAKSAGLCIWTIYRRLKDGQLTGVKHNGRWLIPESELAAALDDGRLGPRTDVVEEVPVNDPWRWFHGRSLALGSHATLRELANFLEEVEQVFAVFGQGQIEDVEGCVVHQTADKLAQILRSAIG